MKKKLEQSYVLGAKARQENTITNPYSDKVFMEMISPLAYEQRMKLYKEWLKGWHTQNLLINEEN